MCGSNCRNSGNVLWKSSRIRRSPSAGLGSKRRTGASALTMSRPVLFHYTAEPAARREIAERVFAALREGVLRVDVRHRYPLAAAADAHRDLEARRTTGPLVLLA
jgi:NADPH:quinone reductase-like Zn-dependent oxidoreductase